MKNIIRIATRNSPLALKQANMAKELLMPSVHCEIVPMTSSGDTMSEKGFKEHGGKGLFLKELEESLLENKCDIAIHSLKDVPAIIDSKFNIMSIMQRENAMDVLVSNKYKSIADMPKDSKIGTSSPRRIAMLKSISQGFKIIDIRGNIQTRLKKMKEEKMDGIILAAAGLHRMDLKDQINEYFPVNRFVPSAGQGILCVEYKKNNRYMENLLSKHIINNVQKCAEAERAFIELMDGDCMSPIGVHATIMNGDMKINAYVSSLDGARHIKTEYKTKVENNINPGKHLAQVFIEQGAKKLLEK